MTKSPGYIQDNINDTSCRSLHFNGASDSYKPPIGSSRSTSTPMSSNNCVDLLSRLEEETERQLQQSSQSAHNGCNLTHVTFNPMSHPKSTEEHTAVASTTEERNPIRLNERHHNKHLPEQHEKFILKERDAQKEIAPDAKEKNESPPTKHRSPSPSPGSSAKEVSQRNPNIALLNGFGRKRSHKSSDVPDNKRRKTNSSTQNRSSVADQTELDVNVDQAANASNMAQEIDTKSGPQLTSPQDPPPGARPKESIDDKSALDRERDSPKEIKERREEAPKLNPGVSAKQKASDFVKKPNPRIHSKEILGTPGCASGSKHVVTQGETDDSDSSHPRVIHQNVPKSPEQRTGATKTSEGHTEHYETLMLGMEICGALKRAACCSKFELDALYKRSHGLLEKEYSWLLAEQEVHEVEAHDLFNTIEDMSGKSLPTRRLKLVSLQEKIKTHRQSPKQASYHISNILTPLRLATLKQDGILRPLTQLRTSSDVLPGLKKLIELYTDRVLIDTGFEHLLADIQEDGLGSSFWHKRVEHLMQTQHCTSTTSALRSMLSSIEAAKDLVAGHEPGTLATQQSPSPSPPPRPQQKLDPQVAPIHRLAPFNKVATGNANYDRIKTYLYRGELNTALLEALLGVAPATEGPLKKMSNEAKNILGYQGQSDFKVPDMQGAVDKINRVMSAKMRADIKGRKKLKKKTKKQKKIEGGKKMGGKK